MLLAPNPKTCTKYKNKKENQLTNKNREWDKPCHM
jgi:hypothetical protein